MSEQEQYHPPTMPGQSPPEQPVTPMPYYPPRSSNTGSRGLSDDLDDFSQAAHCAGSLLGLLGAIARAFGK